MTTYPEKHLHPSGSRRLPAWLIVLVIVLLLPALALAGDDEAGQDPILDGLLIMLRAEMSEAVILDWLKTVEGRPEPPAAEDLVALREAGASDELLRHFLSMARGDTPPSPKPRPRIPEQPPAPTSPQTPKAPTAPIAEAPPPPAPTPEASSPPARQALGSVPVEIRATYLPYLVEDEDDWDLYLYLDGQLLTYVPTGNHLFDTKPLRFQEHLEPGRHVLRVLQEKHEKRWGGRYEHTARVAREPLVFDLADGEPARLTIAFKQPMTAMGQHDQPLSLEVVQGDRVQAFDDRGGDPEDWPLLCEEIEANIKPGKEPGRAQRKALESCLRWADLWQDGTGFESPPRQEILRGMAEVGYRPIPRSRLSD